MSTTASTRVLSLDLWGTLLVGNPDYRVARDEILHEAFAPHVPRTEFLEALTVADTAADTQAEQTGLDLDWAARIRATLDSLVVPAPGRAEFLRVEHLLHQEALKHPPIPVYDDQPDAVAAVAAHIPVAVTCNTGMFPGSLLRRLLTKAGYRGISVHTYSNEVGASKPAPAIFTATLEGLRQHAPNLTAAQVLHLGDNPITDLDGAHLYGMQGGLVNTSGTPALTEALTSLTTTLKDHTA